MGSEKRSVLVVDDDPQLLAALRRSLSVVYEVLEADTKEAALEVALSDDGEAIAAMVLDLQLPDGHGLDVVRRLTDEGREIPVVVLSGYLSPATFTLASDVGVVHVLQKGCSTEALLDAIALAIEYGEEGTDGSIRGVPIDDVLRSFHLTRRSVSLQVAGTPSGRIDVSNGEVVHAQCGVRQGEDALRELVARGAVDLRTAKLVAFGPLTVSGHFEDVLRASLDEGGGEPAGAALAVPTIGDDEVKDRLMPILARTIGQACSAATMLLARGDGTLAWLREVDGPTAFDHDGALSALERLPTVRGWQWLLRSSQGYVFVATRVASNDLVVAYAPSASAAIRGQLLTGLRAAVRELEVEDMATKPAPRSTLVAGASRVTSDETADALCRAFVTEGLGSEVTECRLGGPGSGGWLGRYVDRESSPSEQMWWLADDLIRGSTGRDLDRLVGGEGAVAQETIVASDDHLVFAAPLAGTACSVLAATGYDLASIGRISTRLRGLEPTEVDERLRILLVRGS